MFDDQAHNITDNWNDKFGQPISDPSRILPGHFVRAFYHGLDANIAKVITSGEIEREFNSQISPVPFYYVRWYEANEPARSVLNDRVNDVLVIVHRAWEVN